MFAMEFQLNPRWLMAANEISNDFDLNPCPICLSSIVQDQGSYLDKCFHKFCYSCILRWTNVVVSRQSREPSSVKCPLCKRENFSIIYGYDGASFQRHYVHKTETNSEFFTEAHRYRLKCYYTEPPGELADKLNVTRYWMLRKYLQHNHFLPYWLTREIQALMQEEDVSIVMHHITGVIDSLRRDSSQKSRKSHETAREELRRGVSEAARPFLTGRTERFVNELELFLASGLNIEAFDEVYKKHLGWNSNENGEEDDDDHQPPHELIPQLYIFCEDSD